MALKQLPSIISRTSRGNAEIVTKSRPALTAIHDRNSWQVRTITEVKRLARRVEETGGTLALTWLPSSTSSDGYKAASVAAQQAARQPPKTMRPASLAYVKQAVKERWKPTMRLKKHVKDARKAFAARYLQLISGHAITAAYLMRIGKAEEARCWWCSSSRQTVEHLLLECRKWRREREILVQRLKARNIAVSERPDRRNLKTLFEECHSGHAQIRREY